MNEIRLRPYQRESIEAVGKALERGVNRQLLVLPTGGGKSVVASRIPQSIGVDSALYLAHRIELLDQMATHLRLANPDLLVEIDQGAGNIASSKADMVVASVQTLGRANSKRIERWSPHQFGAVIIDEAHHAYGKTYHNILKYFDPKLILGITATPFRGDGKRLSNIFDEVIYSKSIQELIHDGEKDSELGPYLCRIRGMKVKSKIDLRRIHVAMGDFSENELASAVNVDARNSLIISAIEEHASDRKSILIFCVNVAHAQTLCKQMKDRGLDVEAVFGHTNEQERYDILKKFHSGNLKHIISVGVLTEGYDAPRTDCVVLARPTMSAVLYTQMIGRSLRPFPNKPDCLIIDIVDVIGRFPVQSISSLFGVREIDFLGNDVIEHVARVREAGELGINILDDENLDDLDRRVELVTNLVKGTVKIQTQAQVVDLFRAVAPAEEVTEYSIFPWVKVGPNEYSMSMIGDKSRFLLKQDALGEWSMSNGQIGHQWTLDAETDVVPFKWADRIIKGMYDVQQWKAKRVDARWRQAPATENQIRILRDRFRIMALPTNLSKGDASDLIDFIISRRQHAKAQQNARY